MTLKWRSGSSGRLRWKDYPDDARNEAEPRELLEKIATCCDALMREVLEGDAVIIHENFQLEFQLERIRETMERMQRELVAITYGVWLIAVTFIVSAAVTFL